MTSRSFRTVALFIVTMMIVPITAFGQGGEDKPEVSASLRLFMWAMKRSVILDGDGGDPGNKDGIDLSALYIISGDKKSEVPANLKVGAYSRPFNYKGLKTLRFHSAQDDRHVGDVILPAGRGQYVLLFIPKGKKYQIVPLPYGGERGVKNGELNVYNMSGKVVGVQIGTQKKALKDRGSHTFDVSRFTDYQMPIAVYERLDASWKKGGVKTRMAVRYDIKNIGVIYQIGEKGRVGFTLLPPMLNRTEKSE
ncbi:MAG: hypothetical protein H7A51_18265 [Akkermansiaceae bacterium]|nr:hypothetical protein [Akkermansiaceae bacterium]